MNRCVAFAYSTLVAALCGCSSDPGANNGGEDGGGGSSSGSGPWTNTGSGGGAGGPDGGTVFDGGACPVDLGFPAAKALPNLTAHVVGQTARILFDPRDDAKDYRIYALPAKGDVAGSVNQNAVYRCAGNYQVVQSVVEDEEMPQSFGVRTTIESDVEGYTRSKEEATLGYVFTTPGSGRTPVYALGDSATDADNSCYFQRWPESRVKAYTTSEALRKKLLAKNFRDDGVAFYVPETPSAGTRAVFGNLEADPATPSLYVAEGPELEKRKTDGMDLGESFQIHAEKQPGSEPLKRVHYLNGCGRSHDELAVTEARFRKAYTQGSQPVAELHWAGLTEGTTLVVEALDGMCPFQGMLSPTSRPAATDSGIDYPAFHSLEDLRKASPTGEVYVGGQGEPDASPQATARGCVTVEPAPAEKMDWAYDGKPEDYSKPEDAGLAILRFDSPSFDVEFYGQATNEWGLGSVLGELWAVHADVGADVSSLVRLMAKKKGTVSADAFLHVTMEVDTLSTTRRYPQILISDLGWPLTNRMTEGKTIVVQTFGADAAPTEAQIEFCDGVEWAVNDQCPLYDMRVVKDDPEFLSPRPELNGLQGQDRTVRFDVYTSTSRVYVFTNGVPYGCADLPGGGLPAGPVSVTFGDALYHSGVDLAYWGPVPWYPFHDAHMKVAMSRHYSNLGFASGKQQPKWDHGRLPCAPSSAIQ